jgi:hypothetical protein
MKNLFVNPWNVGEEYNTVRVLENPFQNYNVFPSYIDPNNPENKNTPCTCKQYKKANNFSDLIYLIKEAELRLISNNIKDLGDQINCLRGIYYGATHSLDYVQEKSDARNKGFRAYTTFNIKHNAQEKLKCGIKCTSNLFQALFNSPEVIDSSVRMLDVGHLFIGMDARRSWLARNINWPLGGTGLENVTLIGDLGGGAGMLAFRRVEKPTIRAKSLVFDSNYDYGCSVNIEGDIASYYCGLNTEDVYTISNPENHIQLADGSEKSQKIYKGIYSAIESYISPNNWPFRSKRFLKMLGFEFDNENKLTNRTKILENIVDSVEGFAQAYIILRANDKNYEKEKLFTSFAYINSAAKEVCEIWLDGMLDLITNPSNKKFKAVTDPNPTVVDLSDINEIKDNAKMIYKEVMKWIRELK